MSLSPFLFIQEGHVAIVERMGKYNRSLKEGLHLMIPCVDQLHYVRWSYANSATITHFRSWKIPLSEQCYDPNPVKVVTCDGVNVNVDLVVYFVITDPIKAVYGTTDLFRGIENLIETTLSATVRQLDSDKLLPAQIDKGMRESDVPLESTLKQWGVAIKLLRVQHVTLPKAVQKATTKLVATKRAAMVNLEKLESEFRRKVKLAKHAEMELESQYRMEMMQNEHQREEQHKQAEFDNLATKAKADTAAYAIQIKATAKAKAEAEARKIAASTESEIMKSELEVLKNADEKALSYMTLRHRTNALSQLNQSATNTLVLGPEAMLESASRVPLFQAMNRSS